MYNKKVQLFGQIPKIASLGLNPFFNSLTIRYKNFKLLRGKRGGKNLISPFPFIFTYVIDLSFLVSKSGQWPLNSRWFRLQAFGGWPSDPKISQKRDRNTGFGQGF